MATDLAPGDDEKRPAVHGFGVEFFRFSPDMNQRVEEWAQKRGVRVLTIVPVYFGEADGATRRRPE